MVQLKVTQQQLDHLLELNAIDQLLVTTKNQLTKLSNSPEAAAFQQKVNLASAKLLDANKVLEVIALELSRNNVDLDLVEQREKRDHERLEQAANPKDAAGLQSELATLAKRRSELEDASLELMEQQLVAQQSVSVASAEAEEVRRERDEFQQKADAEAIKLQSAISLTQQDRTRVVSLLSAELVDLYAKKRDRGSAVGFLVSPECGACHMTISSSEYSKLLSQDSAEMIFCPECSAILVRR